MILRHYQSAAIVALYAWLREYAGNPCICIPTGGGKTPVIATICNDTVTNWGGRVVVVSHVKELIEQTASSIGKMFPNLYTGVYSSGLGSRDTRPPVVVAGIQSVYNKVNDLGPRDLIVIDECHLLPPAGYGRYRSFIDDMRAICPHTRIVGLTATPYRTGSGWLCGPEELFQEICYEISVRQLIDEGFLCRLVTKCGAVVDTSGLHVRAGEFVESEMSDLMMTIVYQACEKLVERTVDRNSVLVFSAGVKHAEAVVACLSQMQSARVELTTAKSLDFSRAKNVVDFKSGELKYLTNVGVYTTGFDAPNVDCIALLRATVSPGLFYQMVGRGFRIHESKADCLVLDFGDNVRRHGPVDQIRPKDKSKGEGIAPQKICPGCESYVAISAAECPDCGHVFDVAEKAAPHEAEPSNQSIVSWEPVRTDYDVLDVRYLSHRKKGWEQGDAETLRVRYKISMTQWADEWVCFDHTGYARMKAEAWWRARSNDPLPDTTNEAFLAATGGALAQTLKVTVEEKHGEKFPRIVRYEVGPKPEATEDHGTADGFEFPAPVDDEFTF